MVLNIFFNLGKNNVQDETRSFGKNLSMLPDIKLTFGRTQRAVRIAGERKYAHPRTELRF